MKFETLSDFNSELNADERQLNQKKKDFLGFCVDFVNDESKCKIERKKVQNKFILKLEN